MGQIRVSTSKVVEVLTNYLEADHSRADAARAG